MTMKKKYTVPLDRMDDLQYYILFSIPAMYLDDRKGATDGCVQWNPAMTNKKTASLGNT